MPEFLVGLFVGWALREAAFVWRERRIRRIVQQANEQEARRRARQPFYSPLEDEINSLGPLQ